MAVDELVLGRSSRPHRPRRRPPLDRIARAVVAFAVVGLALFTLTVLTSRGWSEPATVPPLGAEQPRPLSAWQLHLPYARVDQTTAVVTTRGHRLDAWIFTPVGAPTGLPGVVLVGDRGAQREDLRTEAGAFARGGVAALVYDEARPWSPFSRGDEQRAADALAAVDVLVGEPDVDPDRVGLVGLGEGGWVVPLAAEQAAGRVSYVVLAGAPVVTPTQRTAWRVDQVLAAAPSLVRRAAAVAVASVGSSSGGSDPSSALARTNVPVYAVWGADDRTVPVAAAAARLRALVGGRGSVEVVAEAGHRIPPVTDGWTDDVSDWIRRGQSVEATARGVEPAVATGLAQVPSIGAWGDLRVLVGLSAAAAVTAALAPVRRRPEVSAPGHRGVGRAGSPPPRPPG